MKLQDLTVISNKSLKLSKFSGVQWLQLCAFTAISPDLIPDWGTKIPEATWYSQRKIKKGKRTGSKSWDLVHLKYWLDV